MSFFEKSKLKGGYNKVNSANVNNDELPMLIHLNTRERNNPTKLDHKASLFISKVLRYSKVQPLLVPPQLDIEALKSDLRTLNCGQFNLWMLPDAFCAKFQSVSKIIIDLPLLNRIR